MKPKVEYLVQYFAANKWCHYREESTLLRAMDEMNEAKANNTGTGYRIIKRTITEEIVEVAK